MYQQNNGKIAMGNGGFLGQGFLKGDMTQSGAVPENQNDMILSVAGEEFGFIGALAVILILTILILRVGQTGLRARDNGGYLMCSGIAVMLFAQTFVNIGMELSLLPCIGIIPAPVLRRRLLITLHLPGSGNRDECVPIQQIANRRHVLYQITNSKTAKKRSTKLSGQLFFYLP